MLNLKKFFFSHQQESAAQVDETPEPVVVRQDFYIPDYDQMPVRQLLQILRDRTYDFALDNGVPTAYTEFSYIDELPLMVELTENYDILYTVNRFKTYSVDDAIAVITDAITF